MKILKSAQKRTPADTRSLQAAVTEIIDRVCQEGDRALKDYSLQFDKCSREDLRVSPKEIQNAYEKLTPQEIEDMKTALGNIRAFAQAQRGSLTEIEDFSPMPGIHT